MVNGDTERVGDGDVKGIGVSPIEDTDGRGVGTISGVEVGMGVDEGPKA